MSERTINNLAEYLDLLGADSMYGAGRRLYKDTACGPWTSFVIVVKKSFTRHVSLCVSRGSNGFPRVSRREEGHEEHDAVNPDDLQFLGFCPRGFLERSLRSRARSLKAYRRILDDFIRRLAKDPCSRGYTLRVNAERSNRHYLWVNLTQLVPTAYRTIYYGDTEAHEPLDEGVECAGVEIGSIVEGSDAEIGPETLMFPFTVAKWDEVVRNIDNEADAEWRLANESDAEDDDNE